MESTDSATLSQARGKAAYDEDAGDRIVAVLAQQKIAARERLAPAARLAGQQLEWIMPVILGSGGNGRLIAGKVTRTFPRALVFVLADEQRVAIIHVLDQPNLVEQFVEIARQLRQYIA